MRISKVNYETHPISKIRGVYLIPMTSYGKYHPVKYNILRNEIIYFTRLGALAEARVIKKNPILLIITNIRSSKK